MSQDGNWAYDEIREEQASDREPPCTLDVQVHQDHELEFHFDAEGHVSKVVCSCGREGTVEML